ncbi:hypothetical protein GIB67_029178 [Kingdonia uniflora]|uniref:Kinesin motor domain-containing protein n=1 Tax=Kingdonia uniflora TaxID=39325 RepID=A0A7J7LS45_9MAGN|nr:hypothetical protein GIB67_029178 [Kingdonia uniflora]
MASSSSRGRSSSPFGYRKPSSPNPYSSTSSSSSLINGRSIPRSASSSSSQFFTSKSAVPPPSRTRSESMHRGSRTQLSRTPIPFPTAEELIGDPVDASRSGDSISVTIRFRPLSEREFQRGDEIAWYGDGDKIVRSEYNPATAYAFDRVFGPSSASKTVYDVAARPVVKAAMEGVNGTVFAYGVTSSGKTHTMHGDHNSPGVIPLAIKDVFSIIQETPGREFLLRVSYLEIYNEASLLFSFLVINDLLDPTGQNLRVREDAQLPIVVHAEMAMPMVVHSSSVFEVAKRVYLGIVVGDMAAPYRGNDSKKDRFCESPYRWLQRGGGTYVEGIKDEVVLSPGHALSFIAAGEEHRHVGSNNFNLFSSRSHTIFTLMIESSARGDEYDEVIFSQLNLIDLAGSESSKTETTGLRRKEGSYINKSLLTLGTVIGKLSEGKASHVPYRDSKLTRLLQSSLSGRGHVSLICTITPASSNMEETHNTLKFASRAKRVEIFASRNRIIDEKSLIKKYQKEISNLKEELDQLRQGMLSGIDHDEILTLKQKLEEGQVKMQSRLEEEEEAKAALMSRIQRLTKLILVSTKNTIPGLSDVPNHQRHHSLGEDDKLDVLGEGSLLLESESLRESPYVLSVPSDSSYDHKHRSSSIWSEDRSPVSTITASNQAGELISGSRQPTVCFTTVLQILIATLFKAANYFFPSGFNNVMFTMHDNAATTTCYRNQTVENRETTRTVQERINTRRNAVFFERGSNDMSSPPLPISPIPLIRYRDDIDEILDQRVPDSGRREFLIRWLGMTSDQMDLFAEQVKMLAGEIAFSTSTLKRLMEQSAKDPDALRDQIQKLEAEIHEKRRQMGVLEKHIIESGEASMSNASLVDMQQTVTRLMTLCNEKGFELEIKSADNRILQEQLQDKCSENKELQEKILYLQQQLVLGMGDNPLSSDKCVSDEYHDDMKKKIQSKEIENEKLKVERINLMEENSGLRVQNQKLAEEASYAKELASAAAVELKNLAEEVTKLSLQNARQEKELLATQEVAYSRNAGRQNVKVGRRGWLNGDPEHWNQESDDIKIELQARKHREAALEVALAEKELAEQQYRKKVDEAKKRESALENDLASMWVLVAKLKKEGEADIGLNIDVRHSEGTEVVNDLKENEVASKNIGNQEIPISDGTKSLHDGAHEESLVVRLKARMQEMKDRQLESLGSGDANSHVLCKPCSLACTECPICRQKIVDRIFAFPS